MMAPSKIEWTEETWNPVTGCSPVSAGCTHCYAKDMTRRLQAMGNPKYRNGFDKVTTHEYSLSEPLRWRKPRRVFTCSMSDLFHEHISLDFSRKVFDVMDCADQHVFMVLTKRAERTREFSARLSRPDNVWAGVTVEHADYLDRVNLLRAVPAALRYLPLESLLGPLDLDLRGIGWVIVGGESGPNARPMKAEGVRCIRDQCVAAGIRFFFKQWGGT